MPGPLPRLTILHLNEKTSLSTGSVIQMLLAARQQLLEGHSVIVGTRPGERIGEVVAGMGAKHVEMPFRHELDLRTVLGLRQLIREERPDVIHVHKGKAHTLALGALVGNPEPALVVNRGVSFPLTWMNRAKYQTARVARVVTVCNAIRDIVVETGKVDPEKVQVIYAGTDTDRFDPARVDGERFRAELGLRDGEVLFTHAGIRPWKGYRETLAAFEEVARDHSGARLAFVGFDGARHHEQLQEAIAQSDVRDRIFVVGHRPDMENVLAGSDVVVDSSWSGTGITGTIREGMAMARPVIATRCGGNEELLSAPDLGWLVAPRDTAALAAAMINAISAPEFARKKGERAREHVVRNFSMKKRASRLASLYGELIQHRPVAAPVRQATADRSY